MLQTVDSNKSVNTALLFLVYSSISQYHSTLSCCKDVARSMTWISYHISLLPPPPSSPHISSLCMYSPLSTVICSCSHAHIDIHMYMGGVDGRVGPRSRPPQLLGAICPVSASFLRRATGTSAMHQNCVLCLCTSCRASHTCIQISQRVL